MITSIVAAVVVLGFLILFHELGHFLVAKRGIDQHQPVGVLHQQAAHGQRDAIPLIRRHPLHPEGARHHAEHRPAVQPLKTALQSVAAETADLKRSRERHGRAI